MSQKFEQLIQLIINEDEAKARELFHQIVVEKSKEIYESLEESELEEAEDKKADEELDESMEENVEESMGGDAADKMVDEIAADEQAGVAEDDMEPELGGDDELGEPDMHGDADMDDMGGDEEDLEDRVVDLEDALDELKAEFARLMDEEPGDDEDFGDEEGMDDEEGEEMPEGMVREYVEKVKTPANSEGAEVGSGGSVAVNKKSVGAGKNPMNTGPASGKNLVNGGAEKAPDGAKPGSAPKADGLPGAGNFANVPGADAKATKLNAEKGKTSGEDGGTNKKSPVKAR